jgi:3D (Asp-Asp-Asp) domain-containing protein
MKTVGFVIVVLAFTLTTSAFAREQSMLARVTVYWASGGGGSDSYTRQHKCATGARLRSGHCAVDPKKIPYGSKVVFQDVTCVAVDTGRDVINRKAARRCGRTSSQRSALVIDRFFETKSQALRWANAHPHFMTVRVLSPNEQLADNRKSPAVTKQRSQPIARASGQAIVRSHTSVLAGKNIGPTKVANGPQNKLLADNANRSAFQLPRRF